MDFLREILLACITGIITFLITKYEYHRNVPLEKMEVAYNRIYFPLFQLIRNEKDVAKIVKQSEQYFQKYYKYVDRSTLIAFNYIRECKEDYDEKLVSNYKDNIYSMNSKLRRRLGYLEPTLISAYRSMSTMERRIMRIVLWMMFTYLLSVAFTMPFLEKYEYEITIGFAIVFITFIGELLVLFVESVVKWFKTRKKKLQQKPEIPR